MALFYLDRNAPHPLFPKTGTEETGTYSAQASSPEPGIPRPSLPRVLAGE